MPRALHQPGKQVCRLRVFGLPWGVGRAEMHLYWEGEGHTEKVCCYLGFTPYPSSVCTVYISGKRAEVWTGLLSTSVNVVARRGPLGWCDAARIRTCPCCKHTLCSEACIRCFCSKGL